MFFLKRTGKIRRFLSFDVKISQNWLKFLGCPQNFWSVTLKNVKMLLKIYFCETFCIFPCTKCFESNFWAE